MDISEKYIKMCESAKEIQLQWNFKIEDYIFDPADGEARVWLGYPSKNMSRLSGYQGRIRFKKFDSNFTNRTLGVEE